MSQIRDMDPHKHKKMKKSIPEVKESTRVEKESIKTKR